MFFAGQNASKLTLAPICTMLDTPCSPFDLTLIRANLYNENYLNYVITHSANAH